MVLNGETYTSPPAISSGVGSKEFFSDTAQVGERDDRSFYDAQSVETATKTCEGRTILPTQSAANLSPFRVKLSLFHSEIEQVDEKKIIQQGHYWVSWPYYQEQGRC